MIAVIHSNWDSDIVLEKGELEKIVEGNVVFGEIANYDELGEVYLSKNKDEQTTALSLDWNIKEPSKYYFKIHPSGLRILQNSNFIHGRYEGGLNGSKLSIYGPGKNELIKSDIEFSIEMIKLNKKST